MQTNDDMQGLVTMQPFHSFRDCIAVVGGDEKTRTFQAITLVTERLNDLQKKKISEAHLLGVGYTFHYDKTSDQIMELINNQSAGQGLCFVIKTLDPYLQSKNCFAAVEHVK
jgi:hypothetical protein